MTEQEWLTENRPRVLVEFLRRNRRLRNDRKLRLFACACGRQLWHLMKDQRCHLAVEIGERFADGEATDEQCKQAASAARASADYRDNRLAGFRASLAVATFPGYSAFYAATVGEDPEQSNLLRDIMGNPFRPVAVDLAWLAWKDRIIPKLAQAAYDDRSFDGLSILADALEESGCTNKDLLDHCRGPGPHVRGCWALDLALGKEFSATPFTRSRP